MIALNASIVLIISLMLMPALANDKCEETQIENQECSGTGLASAPTSQIVREFRYPLRICVTIIALAFLTFNVLWEMHRG
jgi:hypothetical protein